MDGWRKLAGCLVLTAYATGCQCCPLTNHYASAIDCIADHEHRMEVLYTPCFDLTRIGRPDWCHCSVNRWFCRCRCEHRKPLPHIVDTTAASYVGLHCPWADGGPSIPDDDDSQKLPAEELPSTPANGPTNETSSDQEASSAELWSLDR